MDQIKDTLQTIREQAELNSRLLTLDLLQESADICGAVTFGLTTFIARALKVLRMAVKEETRPGCLHLTRKLLTVLH